jgi:hypothetical protein
MCGIGTFYANDTAGCQDFDSCAGNNPCARDNNSNGTCIDLSAPSVDFQCGCKPGYAWKDSACLGELGLSWIGTNNVNTFIIYYFKVGVL